jgi:hypothetical protein
MFRLIILFGVLCSFGLSAQINISYPVNRQVFQRNNSNEASISVLGNCSDKTEVVQVKLEPVVAGQGTLINWTNLDTKPTAGFYQGKVIAKGGWYTLKIRSLIGTSVKDSTILARVGVGENFIIAGQSNAQGVNRRSEETGAADDRVICANFYNWYSDYNVGTNAKQLNPQNLDFPLTEFSQLSSKASIGPMGLSPYYWANLGDLLVQKYNVPVCFFNVAWSGTALRNWIESAKGLSSVNPWEASLSYPKGFPYANLQRVAEVYGLKNGFRSVLWHQGETDTNLKTNQETYLSNLKELISLFRKNSGMEIPWLVSEASYISFINNNGLGCKPGMISTAVIQAQRDITSLKDLMQIYSGPATDDVEIPRKSDDFSVCVHFTNESFQTLGNRWLSSISTLIAANPTPILAKEMPQFTKICGPSNELLVSATTNFKQISWMKDNAVVSNSFTKLALKPGNYSLILKDDLGFEFSVPSIQITTMPIPTAPLLKASGDTLFCEGKSVQLTASLGAGTYLWNTNEKTSSIISSGNGTFKVQTISPDACTSAFSASIQTKVFANPSSPSITSASPYFLYGGLKLFDVEFNWELNNAALSVEKNTYLRVKESGKYSLYASKKYMPGPTCISPKVEFSYSLPADGGLSMYPNPAVNMATIQSVSSLKGAEFTLYAHDGRLALQGKIDEDGAYGLKVDGLSNGLYKLIIKTTNQVYQRTLVVGN